MDNLGNRVANFIDKTTPRTEDDRQKRLAIVNKIGAAIAATSALFALTHEYTVDERTAHSNNLSYFDGENFVNAGKPIGEAVCAAAEDMIGANNFNKQECSADLAGFNTPDDIGISVKRTFQPIGLEDGAIVFGLVDIKTDLDPLTRENR